MDTDKCSVYELFEQSKRHVVPLYQRPYVWNEAAQWGPLWEDVTAKVASTLEGRSPTPHFLGAVVRSQTPAPGLRLDVRLVIDGQQRLTTFQVLLATLRDLTEERAREAQDEEQREAHKELLRDFEKVTVNAGGVKADFERFKVWPTNTDREVFTAVMTARSRTQLDALFPPIFKGTRKKVRQPDPRLLVEAYRFFDEKLRAVVAERDSQEVLEAFLDCLRKYLMLVIIDLDQDDDPQVIFETLNFRGAPLLASDLIKNFLFGKAIAQGHVAEDMYLQHWKHFDDDDVNEGRFWKHEGTQGRLTKPVFDLFLEHYLTSKSDGEPIVSRHLYQAFKTWWKPAPGQPERAVPAELRDLARYSAVYRTFYEPRTIKAKAPRLSTFLRRIAVVDTTTIYPLLLFLLVDRADDLPGERRDAAIVDLESFIVRRWLCGRTSKNYNRLFAAMTRDLRKMATLEPVTIRQRLLEPTGVDAWPTDAELESTWLHDPIYKRVKSEGIQMVLRAVHDARLTSKQEHVELPEGLTVEHVMPQSWGAHWPAPPAGAASDEETSEERRDRLIHTFGNLTLLTQELNSDVSNGAYAEKRKHITLDSLLLLNHDFQALDTWDEAAILARGKALLAFAKKTWPRPA